MNDTIKFLDQILLHLEKSLLPHDPKHSEFIQLLYSRPSSISVKQIYVTYVVFK